MFIKNFKVWCMINLKVHTQSKHCLMFNSRGWILHNFLLWHLHFKIFVILNDGLKRVMELAMSPSLHLWWQPYSTLTAKGWVRKVYTIHKKTFCLRQKYPNLLYVSTSSVFHEGDKYPIHFQIEATGLALS